MNCKWFLILIAMLPLADISTSANADVIPPSRDFVVCTPGAVNACVSIQVLSSTFACGGAIGVPGSDCQTVGQGTLLMVNVRNLQGSIDQDNSEYFAFEGFGLLMADGINVGTAQGDSFQGWYRSELVGSVGIVRTGRILFQGFGGGGLIGAQQSEFLGSHFWGCGVTTNPFWGSGGMQTCDSLGYTGYQSYTYRFDNLFTAYDVASVGFFGEVSSSAAAEFPDNPRVVSCGVTYGLFDTNTNACTVVVSEPTTLGLLVLGLAVIGFKLVRKSCQARRLVANRIPA